MEGGKQKKKGFEPSIVGFLCNWCSYAGADLAGTSRLEYPPNLRVIRVMCSSRVNPLFVLKAYQRGADGILIGGCHPQDCHYMEGNYYTRRRFMLMRRLLDYMGVDSRRLRVEWVSASEGERFAEVVREYTDELKKMGPLDLKNQMMQDER
ncbi:MAG: methyl-viologen-reducing hydrogenase subunit delta [Candidatus Altiarchaeales archaeon ex4484_96]|nr:MAG: methyl-viologen-reducing hydrogenase subunit delta [Candidatus Altiarchaeales archaeon ex4484_96]